MGNRDRQRPESDARSDDGGDKPFGGWGGAEFEPMLAPWFVLWWLLIELTNLGARCYALVLGRGRRNRPAAVAEPDVKDDTGDGK